MQEGMSYVCGAPVPLIEKTISQAVSDTAARFPDREALVVCHQNVRLTWRELDREVTRTARGLVGLGLRPGDRAGIWASNCLEWILLQHAASRARVVLVNVNPAYRSHELRYVLKKSRIRALFLWEKDTRANYREILTESRNGDDLPLEHVVWLGQSSWDEMIAGGCDVPPGEGSPDDVANIQYTSGTTGQPKGVLLTHRGLLNNGMAIGLMLKADETDRIVRAGAAVSLLRVGDRFHGLRGKWRNADSAIGAVRPHGHAGSGPQRAGHGPLRCAHHVRGGVGASRVRALRSELAEERRDVGRALPRQADEARGRAHACRSPGDPVRADRSRRPVITMSSVEDPFERRVTTIGTAAGQHRSADRRSARRARSCPSAQQGELCTRGYLVMKGYDADPEATAGGDRRRRLAAHRRPGGDAARTATSASRAAPRTPSFAAARTFTRARWRISCTPTPRSPTSTWWACPTPSWARPCWRGFN